MHGRGGTGKSSRTAILIFSPLDGAAPEAAALASAPHAVRWAWRVCSVPTSPSPPFVRSACRLPASHTRPYSPREERLPPACLSHAAPNKHPVIPSTRRQFDQPG